MVFCRIFHSFVAKSVFLAIHAILSQNQFCRDFCPFAWRKIEPKIMHVEKKLHISGIGIPGCPVTGVSEVFSIDI